MPIYAQGFYQRQKLSVMVLIPQKGDKRAVHQVGCDDCDMILVDGTSPLRGYQLLHVIMDHSRKCKGQPDKK